MPYCARTLLSSASALTTGDDIHRSVFDAVIVHRSAIAFTVNGALFAVSTLLAVESRNSAVSRMPAPGLIGLRARPTGEWFAEIGLLQRRQRTATAVASTVANV